MLREISDDSKPDTRWFTDEEIDLYVWFEQRTVVAFQICYNKTKDEQAITWKSSGGFSHTLVDSDDDSPGRNMSPLLLDLPPQKLDSLVTDFTSRSSEVPQEITSFILEKLSS